jgi:hypothetical protein
MRNWIVSAVLLVGCGSSEMNAPADLAMSVDLTMTVSGTGCDVMRQNCDPGLKCTVVNNPDPTMLGFTMCTPDGTVAEGEACTRSSFGDDNCVKGTECTVRGVAANQLFCRKLCHADDDCTGGQLCSDAGDNDDGLCLKPCTPLGSDCPAPLDCSSVYPDVFALSTNFAVVFACRTVGSGGVGTDCSTNGDADCQAGMVCNSFDQTGATPVCVALCQGTCPSDAGAMVCAQVFANTGAPGICPAP